MVIAGLMATTAFAQDAIITGTDGNDVLTGTAASESIYGLAGNDVINGGGGDDELDGGPGADVLNGGPGDDVVSYSGTTGVSVTLDGMANDGAPGEGDNVGADVEDIFGSDGPDTLVGDGGANTIDGGAGNDRITGGAGKDALFGGDGDDVINAQDGQVDRIDCGAGSDDATVDRNDIVHNCEHITEPPISDDLTLLPRQKRLIVGSIDTGSSIVIACARGCHPSSSPSKKLLKKTSVAGPVIRFTLPNRVAGATLEIGVTERGGLTSCTPFRVGRRFAKFKILKGERCTTVARSKAS